MSRKSFAIILLFVCMLAFTTSSKAELVDLDPDTFQTVVNDPSKNAFVLFYAPWCGHCKNMMPAWEELATKYPSSGEIVIARINGSQHRDIADTYDVNGYPTMILFSKDNKKGVSYESSRTLDAFESFIKENAN